MPAGKSERHIEASLYLYAQLTEGVGEFNFSVQMRVFEANITLGNKGPVSKLQFSEDRLEVLEEVFHLTNVPFPRPDLYEFKLIANHAELEGGSCFLRVLAG